MNVFDDMSLEDKIRYANALLPGEPAPDNENDPRWEAMLEIAYHLEGEPEPIWRFIKKWGVHEQDDLRSGIACCLLEHLLEYHFEEYFPRVTELAKENSLFSKTVFFCRKFGKSKLPENAAKLDGLLESLQH